MKAIENKITYKTLKTMDEMQLVSELEQEVWNVSPIPTHQTLTAVKNGGIIIGAFDENKLVGFSYGFAGFKNKKVSLCSHMLGISANYRSKGIGENLKYAQKEEAVSIGYDLMNWTYDPLQTRNAYLNLTKLHGVCDTYIQDCYGKMEDGLNEGLPSDRFQIDWWLESDYVNHYIKPKLAIAVVLETWKLDEHCFPIIDETFDASLTYDAEVYTVPVPSDIGALKEYSLEAALAWRYQTRKIFQKLFAEGYTAIQLDKTAVSAIYNYVLVKKNTLNIPQ